MRFTILPRALETLRLVGSPRLKICYDYCHMFVASESLETSLRALVPHVGFITLKNARWTDTGHHFLLPGDGDTDYPLYFRLLKELGIPRLGRNRSHGHRRGRGEPERGLSAVGEGDDLRLSGRDLIGAALVARERAIHLSAFMTVSEA